MFFNWKFLKWSWFLSVTGEALLLGQATLFVAFISKNLRLNYVIIESLQALYNYMIDLNLC